MENEHETGGLKHSRESSRVENFVKYGVERTRLFCFQLPHITACQCYHIHQLPSHSS